MSLCFDWGSVSEFMGASRPLVWEEGAGRGALPLFHLHNPPPELGWVGAQGMCMWNLFQENSRNSHISILTCLVPPGNYYRQSTQGPTCLLKPPKGIFLEEKYVGFAKALFLLGTKYIYLSFRRMIKLLVIIAICEPSQALQELIKTKKSSCQTSLSGARAQRQYKQW